MEKSALKPRTPRRYAGEEILTIIPARKGSVRLPHKNLRILAGHPLIYWTIRAALQSERLGRIVVSTDWLELAELSRSYGAEVPYIRPGHLSGPQAGTKDVILHALQWFQENEDWWPTVVVTLQPTSPFRLSLHIDKALDLFEQNNSARSLVTGTQIPHAFHPSRVMALGEAGVCRPLAGRDWCLGANDDQEIVARNGPAILITSVFPSMNSLLIDPVVFMDMPSLYSLDINDAFDLELAEAMNAHWHILTTGA